MSRLISASVPIVAAGQFASTVQIYAAYYDAPFSLLVFAPTAEQAQAAFAGVRASPLPAC